MIRHPSLIPILEGQPWVVWEYVDPEDGCITGDPAGIWVGNLEILRGGGGWRDFETVELGKRLREDHSRERTVARAHPPTQCQDTQFDMKMRMPHSKKRYVF
jgi:hypothetical protein